MEYLPVLILILLATLIGGAALLASHFIGPKIWNIRKDTAFECGVPPLPQSQRRFSVHFYLVAILFLLFDVESIFFFPFAVTYKEFLSINSFILLEIGLFVGILLVGYFYVLKKGALDWD